MLALPIRGFLHQEGKGWGEKKKYFTKKNSVKSSRMRFKKREKKGERLRRKGPTGARGGTWARERSMGGGQLESSK